MDKFYNADAYTKVLLTPCPKQPNQPRQYELNFQAHAISQSLRRSDKDGHFIAHRNITSWQHFLNFDLAAHEKAGDLDDVVKITASAGRVPPLKELLGHAPKLTLGCTSRDFLSGRDYLWQKDYLNELQETTRDYYFLVGAFANTKNHNQSLIVLFSDELGREILVTFQQEADVGLTIVAHGENDQVSNSVPIYAINMGLGYSEDGTKLRLSTSFFDCHQIGQTETPTNGSADESKYTLEKVHCGYAIFNDKTNDATFNHKENSQ